MSFRSARVPLTACLLLTLFPAVRAAAQEQKLISFSGLQGKIVAISGNLIQWTDATNAEMYVKIDKKTKLQVLGTAEPSFLTPGLFVRFNAEVTKRGKVVDAIDELTIFTPGNGITTGIFEDGVVDPKATSGRYFLAGRISSAKNDLLTVDTGAQSFKIKLADDAKVKIDVPDYSIARPEDEITITGTGLAKTQIVAKGIEIHLANPLKGAEKKGKKTAKAPSPRGNTTAKGGFSDLETP